MRLEPEPVRCLKCGFVWSFWATAGISVAFVTAWDLLALAVHLARWYLEGKP